MNIGMDIEEMIYVSRFLTLASVLSAAAAIVLFFALDIRHCAKMVRGSAYWRGGARRDPACRKDRALRTLHGQQEEQTEELGDPDIPASTHPCERTVLLDEMDAGHVPGKRPMELLQDIVCIPVALSQELRKNEQ